MFYEPENKEELISICRSLYYDNTKFDVIGYTSNIYYLPDYNADIIISTRKVRNCYEEENFVVLDCGYSVRKLARKMVNDGICGYEGLVDLPGTVAASVFGNSSCFGCSINQNLISFDLLKPNGEIVTLYPKDLNLSHRSTALKRYEICGVILSVKLRKIKGEIEIIKNKAEEYCKIRRLTQPGPVDNLGSIYSDEGSMTLLGFIVRLISKICSIFLHPFNKKITPLYISLCILGAHDILHYVYNWNRYIWMDEKSHQLFWKFDKLHKLLFKKSKYEIEIKSLKPKKWLLEY